MKRGYLDHPAARLFGRDERECAGVSWNDAAVPFDFLFVMAMCPPPLPMSAAYFGNGTQFGSEIDDFVESEPLGKVAESAMYKTMRATR